MITRREFHGHLVRGAAGVVLYRAAVLSMLSGSSVAIEGCGSLASNIENWVPVGIAALKSVELVLQTNGFPLSPAEQLAFDAALAALQALDNVAIAYGKITPPPAGLTQELTAALNVASQQIQAFLQALNLPAGNLLNLVIGLANIILSTIAAFMNQVTPTPAARTMRLTFRVSNVAITVTPKARTPRAFRSDWNGTLDSGKKAGVYVPKEARYSWLSTKM